MPVLVVDDDWAIRESLRLMLEDEGYAVSEARDGVEALAVLRASTGAQVVLLDLMMPRMSGEQVLENVRSDQRLQARVAFIIITADQGRVSKGLRQHLAEYRIPVLGKPLDIDDVLAHVASAEKRLFPTP
jgi:CheY-like chemotaxis protein